MHEYDFISKKITLTQVQHIITKAGYHSDNYTYTQRVDGDGFLVKGTVVMSLTTLRNAAKTLQIQVEISSPHNLHEGASMLEAESTAYQVNITMSPETITALAGGNYYLYGFKAVQTTQSGTPVVWFQTQNYSVNTVVSWEEQYQAYTSSSQIIPNGQIVASFASDINLGQILNVDRPGGMGEVEDGGPAHAIAINNETSTQYTCGISQEQNGAFNPLCAFPLYGNNEDVIAPIEKVLLMFSTKPVNTGTVIEQAYSQGVLLDLTSDNQRDVSYDINLGWSWGGFSWGQAVAANDSLVPLLIESSARSFKRRSLVTW